MRVLILGHSSIVKRRVLPALSNLSAISQIDLASRSAAPADDWPKRGGLFADYADALESSSADIVYISLPNAMHEKWILSALARGRHVVVDKPAALTRDGTRRCLEEAGKRGCLLAEATVFSWHPHMDALREFISNNGPITHIDAQFIIPPLPQENFRNHPEHGGGCLNDMGPYAAAVPRELGLDAPDAVFAVPGQRHRETGVDTGFSLLASYGDGARFTGHFSFEGEYQNRLLVVSRHASVSIERVFSPPSDHDVVWEIRCGNDPSRRVFDGSDTFLNFMAAVLKAVDADDHAQFSSRMIRDADFRHRLSNRLDIDQD